MADLRLAFWVHGYGPIDIDGEDLSPKQTVWELFTKSFAGDLRDTQSLIKLLLPVIRHAGRPSTSTGSPLSAGAGLRLPIKRDSCIMSFRMRRNAK